MPGAASLRVWQRTPSASRPLPDVVELGVRIDLERQLGAARLIALFKLHHEVADLGRQIRAAVLPLGDRKADDLREIVDLPLEVGRLERGVAESLDLNHCSSPAAPRRRATIGEDAASFQRRRLDLAPQAGRTCPARIAIPMPAMAAPASRGCIAAARASPGQQRQLRSQPRPAR